MKRTFESGGSIDSIRGKRCYGTNDWQAKGRTNVIGAMLGKSLLCVCLFMGNINSDIFHQWVIKELIPIAPKKAVIVMDNASFHKREDMKNALINADLILEYLPPYSPDLNPIEHKWAQAKAIRRKHNCTMDELFVNFVN